MKDAGATAPSASNANAPTADGTSQEVVRGGASTFAGGGSGFASGTAYRRGFGGGQVISPSLITVTPRITSSSISIVGLPSLPGVISSSRWRKLVPYNWLACDASREGRSV